MKFIRQQPITSLILTLVLLLIQNSAHAIRPFVTDDARVVGNRLGQVESWLVLDRQESSTPFCAGVVIFTACTPYTSRSPRLI